MRRTVARALIIPILLLLPVISGCQTKSEKLVFQANDTAKKAMESSPDDREKLLEQSRDMLYEAVKDDPKNLDAWKLLGQLDEVLGHQDDAGKDFDEASALDPTDQKLMQKARMYRAIQEMVDNANKALDQIKSGDTAGGMSALKDALLATHSKSTRDKVTAVVAQAVPMVVQQGDQQIKDKKYADAVKTYDQAVRGYILLAEAQGKHTLDPAADAVIHSANEAANAAGTPDATFRLLNDVMTFDPDNKSANLELAQVYLRRNPPDYDTAADLEERGGAPDAEVKKLRDEAKKHRKKG
ncbi:MAG: tetratricopeptide repeat protein [Candidatus Binataceae bacterium]